MSGIKIIGVKVVGICSKCRREGDEIPRNKDRTIIPDKELSCPGCALGEKKPKRQGLIVTLNQLHKLIEELEDEFNDGSNCYSTDDDRKFQINIINKEGLSDTWEIEDASRGKGEK